MESPKPKQRIISKEDAVFWMDKDGCWCNEHGKFEHPRIIKYFNASIRKDEEGYYVCQPMGEWEEKVYFHYEDTALFVFDIKIDEKITLILNTKKKIILNPKQLFIKNDNLYITLDDETIKFTEQCLTKIFKIIEYNNGHYRIKLKDQKYTIASRNKLCKEVN